MNIQKGDLSHRFCDFRNIKITATVISLGDVRGPIIRCHVARAHSNEFVHAAAGEDGEL